MGEGYHRSPPEAPERPTPEPCHDRTVTLAASALALLSAILWGAGDFLGGLASRRVAVLVVLACTQSAGLILALLVLLPSGEPSPPPEGLAWGLLAGASGLAGVALLYRALARGTMGIVAPATGLIAAAIPAAIGIAAGEPVTPLLAAGMAAALAAVVCISAPEGSRTRPGGRPSAGGPATVAIVVGSGLGFAGFYLGIDQAHLTGLGAVQTLVALRLASLGIIAVGLLLLRARGGRSALRFPRGRILAIVLVAALFDTSGNLLYIVANQVGLLSVTVVLGSLYPASTALLAAIVLRERLSRLRLAGVALALAGVVLIGTGSLPG